MIDSNNVHLCIFESSFFGGLSWGRVAKTTSDQLLVKLSFTCNL